MSLKEIRISKKITQEKAASILGVSRKTYIKYENNETSLKSNKLKFFYNELESYNSFDEEHGILTLKEIKLICNEVFDKFDVNFAYLFGSYAKGYAKDTSDVDLCVSTELGGLDFAGLSESIRNTLNKRVDLIRFNNLSNNFDLINEIMKDGVKIY